MSKRAIDKALHDLIPRHTGVLPLELIDLARSLLAQSHVRASSLKADEEIGRTYACAHIACEKLKSALDLPKIEPNPPCPPRIYTKLYGYLSRLFTISKDSLDNAPSRKRKREDSITNGGSQEASIGRTNGKGREIATAGMDKSLGMFRSNRSSVKGMQYGISPEAWGDEKYIPRWIKPVVRLLCVRLDAKAATPHALAGIESALLLPPQTGRKDEPPEIEGKIPAMVVAVMCWLLPRMEGRDLTGSRLKKLREDISDTLRGLRRNREVMTRLGKKDGAWDQWEDFVEGDVRAWIKQLVRRGVFEMDWASNVVEGSANGEGDANPITSTPGDGPQKISLMSDDADEDNEDDRDRDVNDHLDFETAADREQQMGYGLGTMRQPDVDFLSPEKTREKDEFLQLMYARIDAIIDGGYLDQPTEDESGSESGSGFEIDSDADLDLDLDVDVDIDSDLEEELIIKSEEAAAGDAAEQGVAAKMQGREHREDDGMDTSGG